MKKLIRNRLVAVMAVFAMAIGMTGCGSKDTEKGGDTAPATNEAAASENDANVSKSGEVVYPVEIVDAKGDVVVLSSEPKKIISVAPNLTELVYELDAADKLVGRSDYCDYPAEVLDVQTVGNMQIPDIEKIISLEPDVVIISTHFDQESAKKLSDLNIPVIAIFEEDEMAGVYDVVETMGTILNRNEQAAECVSNMKETIKSVETAVNGLEAPTVYYAVGFGEYGDYTAGGDTYISEMITMAGGENIAKDLSGWTITFEELVEADPSIIIISEYMKDEFMSSPNYSVLTAVKEGHVYTLDTNMLDRQGYRNAEGIKALAEIIHPEAFR